jgi:hypothetical protein
MILISALASLVPSEPHEYFMQPVVAAILYLIGRDIRKTFKGE